MLLKFTQNMLLFSICLHYLRCTHSCDGKSYYCCFCSRAREKLFFEGNAFTGLCVCSYGTHLSLNFNHRVNLDVFLLDAENRLQSFTELTKNCSFF